MRKTFELQGHRGARGLKPENTLPAFEAALDAGASSIETDVHLTKDDVPVLCHDPRLGPALFQRLPGADVREPGDSPSIRSLSLSQLRRYRADGNPDPGLFLNQDATPTPVARIVADRQGIHPFAVPTLADLGAFLKAYAADAGKTAAQRQRATGLLLDLELKRVPYCPESIGDRFDGTNAGLLERRVVEELTAAGLAGRAVVRSFDHRAVQAIRALAPHVPGRVLVAETMPAVPEEVARAVGADTYCPALAFVDEALIRRLHQHGVRVLPWTVNRPEDWERLLSWNVDGITTDYPNQLARFLQARGVDF